jgi:GTP pyrophosphokinase
VGVIHSLWKPLPGRFKDMIAMPKFNMYQALHTTVIGPEGRPLEIQIRTGHMHERAEYGVAAHWTYKEDGGKGKLDPTDVKLKWLKSLLDEGEDMDAHDFADSLKGELVDEEVYVFTPKGEVKRLSAGATPLDFAYEVHTDVGHRCVGSKVNGKIVPLHYTLQSGDIVEVLTSKRDRGPSRDWLAVVKTTRARNKIKHWFKQESRVDSEHTGRDLLQEHLKKAGLPAQKITGSALLADVIREMGFRKAEDFYIALGAAKVSPKTVVTKVMSRLKQGEAADEEPSAADLLHPRREPGRKATKSSSQYGIMVEGIDDVPLRLAKCCRPVSGDPIVGYVSLGRGITIHREDCPNAVALRKDPERFVDVAWEGENETSFKVELQVDGWDRHRLLEDLSRTFAEAGINIVEARCIVSHPMVKNRFVVEVPEAQTLKAVITRLRSIDAVFDAYRVTPTAG